MFFNLSLLVNLCMSKLYTPTNLMEAMGDAKVKAIRYICIKEFEKLLSVVDPPHGDEFQS